MFQVVIVLLMCNFIPDGVVTDVCNHRPRVCSGGSGGVITDPVFVVVVVV